MNVIHSTPVEPCICTHPLETDFPSRRKINGLGRADRFVDCTGKDYRCTHSLTRTLQSIVIALERSKQLNTAIWYSIRFLHRYEIKGFHFFSLWSLNPPLFHWPCQWRNACDTCMSHHTAACHDYTAWHQYDSRGTDTHTDMREGRGRRREGRARWTRTRRRVWENEAGSRPCKGRRGDLEREEERECKKDNEIKRKRAGGTWVMGRGHAECKSPCLAWGSDYWIQLTHWLHMTITNE